ncbi:MAG: hypothetical protein WBD36_01745, partial [Bacteroidota bacterium]
KGFLQEMKYALNRGLTDYATELVNYSAYLRPTTVEETTGIAKLVQNYRASSGEIDLEKDLATANKKLGLLTERRRVIETNGKDSSEASNYAEYTRLITPGANGIVVQ